MKFTDRLVLLHTGPPAPGPVRGLLLIYQHASPGGFLGVEGWFMWVDPSLGKIHAVFVKVKAGTCFVPKSSA